MPALRSSGSLLSTHGVIAHVIDAISKRSRHAHPEQAHESAEPTEACPYFGERLSGTS